MPNLDFINSLTRIVRWSGGSHVRIHDVPDELRPLPPFDSVTRLLPGALKEDLKVYERGVRNALAQAAHASIGTPSGPEGVFGRYRIDAVTLFAVPAEGPHGFYSIGRTIESTLRSLNNLLERFHQSFFLYIMTSVDSFISVGNYLAAPILFGITLTVAGLDLWRQTFSSPLIERPVAETLFVMLCTHLVGLASFILLSPGPTVR